MPPRTLLLIAVVLVAGCSAMPAEVADVNPIQTSTITGISTVTEVSTVTETYELPITAPPQALAPLPDVAMYQCHGSGWANLYQWTRRNGELVGTLTTVLADGEAPLIDPRVQAAPMGVQISGGQVVLTVGGLTVAGTVSEVILALQTPQRDGRIVTQECLVTSPDVWNQIVATVRP